MKQAVAVIMHSKAWNRKDKIKVFDIINVFKQNIYQILIFMYSTGQGTIPWISKNYTYILHGFARVLLMKNISDSIKLNFGFCHEVSSIFKGYLAHFLASALKLFP